MYSVPNWYISAGVPSSVTADIKLEMFNIYKDIYKIQNLQSIIYLAMSDIATGKVPKFSRNQWSF